jgi:HK97 family phage major capsid protein
MELLRYQGAVSPPALALMLALGIDPIGYRRDGSPIWPIQGGDETNTATVLQRLALRRDTELEAATAVVTRVEALPEAERRDMNDDELTEVRTHREAADRAIAQITELEALEQRATRAAEQRARFAEHTTDVQVTNNEEIYRRSGGDHSFFRDLMARREGDSEAAERLQRHNAMGLERERRDGTTGATSMGSFIPPVWLVNELAERARVGRTLAPFMRNGGFPTTNSITIPRITTGASVAGQAGENAAVSETDQVTAQLTRSTVTIAGQQDISQQSMDLSPYNVDQIIFGDLRGAYEAELDRQILRGSGTNELLGLNQVAGINAVTYTDATPTVGELYPKVADAIQQIHTARFAAAELVSMAPRRWSWMLAALDSTGRPLVVPSAGQNSIARFGAELAQGIVGEIQGVPIVITGSHATNLGAGTEDQIVICRPSDVILMETAIRTRIHEQVLDGTLTLRLQLFTYANLFAGRFPASISTIGGTGLIAPTF